MLHLSEKQMDENAIAISEGISTALIPASHPNWGESRHRTRILDTKLATRSHNRKGRCKWGQKFAEQKVVCDLRQVFTSAPRFRRGSGHPSSEKGLCARKGYGGIHK